MEVDMVEAKRIFDEAIAEKRHKIGWELERSYDQDFIFEVAKLRGWLETPPKVQVKHFYEQMVGTTVREYWTVERFEEDCQCPNLVPPPTDNEG